MKRLLVYLYFFINLVLIFNTCAEEIKIAELSKGQIVNGPIVISNKIKIKWPRKNQILSKKDKVGLDLDFFK